MPKRRRRALSAGLGLLFLIAAGAPAPAASLEYVGTYIWNDADEDFGGFSGIEISADGTGFHALTDRSHLFWGSIDRDAEGIIRGMDLAGKARLKDSKGTPLNPGYRGDSEGLAIGTDGLIRVSFEGLDRVAIYDDPDAAATRLPPPPQLSGMGVNRGIEALAIRDDGTIFAVPEESGGVRVPFTILTFRDGEWARHGWIRRDGNWLPVGADFGPDGWFYLLERDFKGVMGFASRVRRMQMTPTGPEDEEILLETRFMQYDNLESISVWDDGQGIRLTMISDDNFLFVQRTEVVEYRLRD